MYSTEQKVALVTGAAHRIGAEIVTTLHQQGMKVVIHYRNSQADAEALKAKLEKNHPNTVSLYKCDLNNIDHLPGLISHVEKQFGRLDVLINNASSFYPTDFATSTLEQWDDLMGSNLKAPYFLAQNAFPLLKESQGCIVNIVDIHSQRPLKNHPIYSMAKAGLAMMTKSLAREMGPDVRVNGVSPGAIIWPETALSETDKAQILDKIALKKQGCPQDVAQTVAFLASNAGYISGQIIAVDGGRTTSG
jgi:pteridine reductase